MLGTPLAIDLQRTELGETGRADVFSAGLEIQLLHKNFTEKDPMDHIKKMASRGAPFFAAMLNKLAFDMSMTAA